MLKKQQIFKISDKCGCYKKLHPHAQRLRTAERNDKHFPFIHTNQKVLHRIPNLETEELNCSGRETRPYSQTVGKFEEEQRELAEKNEG